MKATLFSLAKILVSLAAPLWAVVEWVLIRRREAGEPSQPKGNPLDAECDALWADTVGDDRSGAGSPGTGLSDLPRIFTTSR